MEQIASDKVSGENSLSLCQITIMQLTELLESCGDWSDTPLTLGCNIQFHWDGKTAID